MNGRKGGIMAVAWERDKRVGDDEEGRGGGRRLSKPEWHLCTCYGAQEGD